MKFNVNSEVGIKLTERGRTELRKQHEKLRGFAPMIGEYTEKKPDSDGYCWFQLHTVMSLLGHLCTMGRELPFETTIKLRDGDLKDEGGTE
jgi:hypothetical protein